MKDHKNKIKPTLVLNKNNSDGFLDFHSSDLGEVIRVLKKHIEEGEWDD